MYSNVQVRMGIKHFRNFSLIFQCLFFSNEMHPKPVERKKIQCYVLPLLLGVFLYWRKIYINRICLKCNSKYWPLMDTGQSAHLFFEPSNGIRDKRLGPSNKVWGKYSRFLICENRLPLMPTIGTRGPVCQSASAEVS